MADKKAIVKWSPTDIDPLIHLIRGQRVIVDEDIARFYGIATKVLNQAVARNRIRFPSDFAFRLTGQEFANLRSQIVTSSFNYGGRRYRPWVFTEQGVAMLSSVLRSPTAVRVNVEIMRAFVRIRRLLATPGELISQLQKLAESVKLHDDKIRAIEQIIDELVKPEPEPPRGKFGFSAEPGWRGGLSGKIVPCRRCFAVSRSGFSSMRETEVNLHTFTSSETIPRLNIGLSQCGLKEVMGSIEKKSMRLNGSLRQTVRRY